MNRCDICGADHYGVAPVCSECRERARTTLGALPEFQRGYMAGVRAGLGDELLRELLMLTHPDRHPIERQPLATKVTAQLLALRKGN